MVGARWSNGIIMATISCSLIPLLVIFGSLFSHAAQRAKPANSADSVVRELYRVHNNGRGGVFGPKGKKYINNSSIKSLLT
jgi:hypothetical protein